MSALTYWIWLSAAQSVSPRAKTALIHRFGDAENAFFSPRGSFAETEGVSSAEAEILERRDLSMVSEVLGDCEAQHLSVITLQDALYPARLRNIPYPPVALYVQGRLPFIDDEVAIAVIGTRNASPYGLKMARKLSYELAKSGAVVVSGLTSGIDAAAAKGALEAGGCCIGVLATAHEMQDGALSLDVAAKGALISEFCPGTRVLKSHFRDRNRISAGLSVGVLAVEAPQKSGTLLFVSEALEQGREIFAVPGNADAPGCFGTNRLLKDGAKPVTCAWDVLSEFTDRFPGKVRETTVPFCGTNDPSGGTNVPFSGNSPSPAREKQHGTERKKDVDKPEGAAYSDLKDQLSGLSEVQLKIIAAIGKEPTHIDDLVEATGLGAGTVLTQLTVLTVKGYVSRRPGNRVALNIRRP